MSEVSERVLVQTTLDDQKKALVHMTVTGNPISEQHLLAEELMRSAIYPL